MENIDKVVDYINVQRDRYVDELKQYLAIPSISALPEHQGDVRRAAEWSADHLNSVGLENVRRRLRDIPELTDVASVLEVHPQTLRRRLAAEGTTFKEIKNQVRRDTALHFLGKQGLSIEEIAHRAGFSESSAFIRAFKGWTGITPYTYRKGL